MLYKRKTTTTEGQINKSWRVWKVRLDFYSLIQEDLAERSYHSNLFYFLLVYLWCQNDSLCSNIEEVLGTDIGLFSRNCCIWNVDNFISVHQIVVLYSSIFRWNPSTKHSENSLCRETILENFGEFFAMQIKTLWKVVFLSSPYMQ